MNTTDEATTEQGGPDVLEFGNEQQPQMPQPQQQQR